MFKIIMIGDSGTGKSCLLTRYTKDEFDADYKVTSRIPDLQFNFKILIDVNFLGSKLNPLIIRSPSVSTNLRRGLVCFQES